MKQFHATSTSGAKAAAKRLKSRLAELGIASSLPSCQNVVARLRGFSHYHELEKRAGQEAPSPLDAACGPEEAAARRTAQTATLRSEYPTLADVNSLLDHVRPTASLGAVGEEAAALPDIGFCPGWFRVHSYVDGTVPVVAVSEWPEPKEKAFTFVIRVDGGRLTVIQREGAAHEPRDVDGLPGPSRFVVIEDAVWERLGYGPSIHGGKALDGRFRPDEAVAALVEALRLIEGRLDVPLFRALASACLFHRLSEIYNAIEKVRATNPGLRDFCVRHPALVKAAFVGGKRDRGNPPELTDGTADEIALEVIARVVGPASARVALDRLASLRWQPSYDRDFADVAGTLAHLPQALVPTTDDEAERFASCCGMLAPGLPDWLPRRHEEMARLLGNVCHDIKWNSWWAARSSFEVVAESAIERLRHEDPVDLGEEDGDAPADILMRCAGYAIQDFANRVAAPAMRRAGHRFEPGDELAKRIVWASARLVLDGTSVQELVWLGERWLRLPDDPDEPEKGLNVYRKLLAPEHRDLDEGGVVAFLEGHVGHSPAEA